MGHTVLTPRYVKDWPTFRQLADQCQRYRHFGQVREYEKITPHAEFMHSAQAVMNQLSQSQSETQAHFEQISFQPNYS